MRKLREYDIHFSGEAFGPINRYEFIPEQIKEIGRENRVILSYCFRRFMRAHRTTWTRLPMNVHTVYRNHESQKLLEILIKFNYQNNKKTVFH